MADQQLLALDQWLLYRLTSDAELSNLLGERWYADFAPDTEEEPDYPLGVFHIMTAKDNKGMGGVTCLTGVTLLAQVVGEGGGYGDLRPAERRLQELLFVQTAVNVSIDADAYAILGCQRVAPIQRAELTREGVRYNYLGGLFLLHVAALP